MAKKYAPRHAAHLDSPERRQILPVESMIRILDQVPQKTNIADIGCGTGYITVPLAREFSRSTIFAVDIDERMLVVLEERARGLDNIVPVLSTEDNIPIPDNTVDVSFLATVLHEMENRDGTIEEMKRASQKVHYVILVDWDKKDTPGHMGPRMDIRIAPEDAIGCIASHGYELLSEFSPSKYFYGFLFRHEKFE